jgi:Zn-dependent peptidase ImmA (M78 family)
VDSAVEKLLQFVDDYRFIESLVSAPAAINFPQSVPPVVGNLEKFAEGIAHNERSRLFLGDSQPIVSLRSTLEEVGVHVFIDSIASEIAGIYLFLPGFGYCILVNSKHPRERRRWTIAHEYGHFLFDRDNPGIDYTVGPKRKPKEERLADAFAAAFLMPEAGIRQRFIENVQQTNDFNFSDLCRLADFYGASVSAMTRRLEFLSLVAKGTWDRIAASGVAISDLQHEAGISRPPPNPPDVVPKRYMLMAIQAWSTAQITITQLARLLRCDPIDARDAAMRYSEIEPPPGESSRRVSIAPTASLIGKDQRA